MSRLLQLQPPLLLPPLLVPPLLVPPLLVPPPLLPLLLPPQLLLVPPQRLFRRGCRFRRIRFVFNLELN